MYPLNAVLRAVEFAVVITGDGDPGAVGSTGSSGTVDGGSDGTGSSGSGTGETS